MVVAGVVVLVLVVLPLLLLLINRKPHGLPPGEWGWPVVGAWPPAGVSTEDHARALRSKHGDIFTWRMGSRTMVFLSTYPLIKEAFHNPALQDRPDFFSIYYFSYFKAVGLANSNGVVWHNSRRFAVRQLREMGMGKSSLNAAIMDEAAHMVANFRRHVGTPTSIPGSLNVAILNVIWQIISNKRYDVDDPKTHEFNAIISEAFDAFQGVIFDFLPWLEHITPTFARKYLGVERLCVSFDKIKDYIRTVVEEHEAAFDPSDPKDYIDIYLAEMAAQKDDPNSTMSKDDLLVQVADLFTAGSETTAQTIRWALLYLAKYPEVQARAQREIDEAVPRDTLPDIDQKSKMPYLEAIIHEVSRIVSIVPLGLSHFSAEDTQIAGYRIPKGTVIIPNQEMCHKDPAFWTHPDQFYPEHFLTEDGKCISRKDSYLPFSVGKRICPGEGLARTQLYIFLAALLQNFTFSVPEGKELLLEKDPSVVLFNSAKKVDILISERK